MKMYLFLIFVVIFFVCNTCGLLVPVDQVQKCLEEQGYSEIVIVERYWMVPGFYDEGRGDHAVFEITAKNCIGKDVQMRVSASYPFKGITIVRYTILKPDK